MLSKLWTCFTRQPSIAPTVQQNGVLMMPSYQPKWNFERLDPSVESVSSLSNQNMQGTKALVIPAREVARSRLGVEAMYEEAVRVYEQAWGPKHILALDAVNNLGLFYAGQRRTDIAEVLLKRTFDGREAAYGLEHPLTLDAASNLGRLYQKQSRLNEAEVMYTKALHGYTTTMGMGHISTWDTATSLADVYAAQGKLQHVEKMYERVLRGKEKALGPDHLSTLDAVGNMGCLYVSQGRSNDAETMYQRALRGYEAAFGPLHTSTLDIVHNLGLLYQIQGQLNDAEAMYMRALEGYEKVFGRTRLAIYPPALSTLECLANLLYELNRIEESGHCLLRAEAGYDAMFGQLYRRYGKTFTTGVVKSTVSQDTSTPDTIPS